MQYINNYTTAKIKSQINKDGGEVGKWNNFNNAPSYIQGIHTGKMLEDISAEKLSTLISGIPTPWARAKLFKFAFFTIASPDPNINTEGLMQFYNMLHAEWKGMMAVIALYPDRIRFSDPVHMNVRGEDYDIASAFGRMLFNDKDIWSNQDDLAKNPDAQPFIQLIYYRDHLIGGTSPLTGCFTGVDYSKLGNDASDISWYRQGKFEDPTNSLTPEELQKVYLFVKNMNKNQQAFEQKINSLRDNKPLIDLSGFKTVSRKWEEELKNKGQGRLREIGPVAQYGNLSVPYSVLFSSDVPVYMKPDFTFTYTNEGDYKKIGNIQDLLSKDKYVVGWFENASATSATYAPGATIDITSNPVLYAVWEPITITVTLNAGSGAFSDSSTEKVIEIAYGSSDDLTSEYIPSLSGYNFGGWEQDGSAVYDENGNFVYSAGYWNFTSNKTLTAVWTEIPTYSATFNVNYPDGVSSGVVGMPENVVDSVSESVVPSSPSLDGYIFLGWFENGVKVEKLIDKGAMQFVPYAGLRFMSVDTDEYSANYLGKEAFNYSADRQNIWLLPVGVSFRQENVYDSGWVVTPKVDLSYIWAFGDTENEMTVRTPDVAEAARLGYTVMNDGSFLGSIGLEAEKGDWTFGVAYSYQKSSDSRSDRWYVDAKYSF